VVAGATPRPKQVGGSAVAGKILAALARYYSARLPAAVSYNLYKESGSLRPWNGKNCGNRDVPVLEFQL